MLSISRALAILGLAAVAAVAAAALAVATARASEPSPPFVDLSLESEVAINRQLVWGLTIRNNPVGGAGHVVTDVKVLITPRPVASSNIVDHQFAVHAFPRGEASTYDRDTGVWLIHRLGPTDHASIVFFPQAFERLDFEIQNPQTARLQYSRLSASIQDAAMHHDASLLNNDVEDAYFWRKDGDVRFATRGDAGTDVVFLDSGDLQVGDVVTFSVRATNRLVVATGNWLIESQEPVRHEVIYTQYDVRVEIELSPGLAFAPGALPPGDSERPAVARVWVPVTEALSEDIPQVPEGTPLRGAVSRFRLATENVPVRITATPSLEDLPLERRCLTARVVSAQPAFEDPKRRVNDVSTACLRSPPPTVLSDGELDLWWVHDCVGVDAHPCGAADEIRVLARVLRFLISQPDTSQLAGDVYLNPESVVIQVKDPQGRDYDGRSTSLTDGSTVSWHTGRSRHSGAPAVPGVAWKKLDAHLLEGGNYPGNSVVPTLTITGLDGADAPGNARVRWDSAGGFAHFDPHLCEIVLSSHSCSPPMYSRNAFRPLSHTFHYFLEFDDLGTYKVNFGVSATHSNGTTYTADGDYVFHVGPISELRVRDGGASPLAAADEAAYAVVAASNGPDTAPLVQVALRGVPTGSRFFVSEGEYAEGACDAAGLCAGTWTLGELQTSERRVLEGESASPTLTLIPPAGADAPATISASIRNTQDYRVNIDGTTHSTDYFDPIPANSEDVTIKARPGTGDGAPGQPRGLRILKSADPRVVIVSWAAVERVNGWPVERYEVHRSPLPCGRSPLVLDERSVSGVRGELFLDEALGEGEDACYAVRAVNERGGAGYWSRVVSTRGGASLGGLDASTDAITVAEAYGQDTYTLVLDGQPSNDVRVRITSTNDRIARVRPGTLVFTSSDWDVPRTITITGQPDSLDNPDGRRTAVIQHALSGGGTEGAVTPTVLVTVTDDDGARQATVSKSSLALAEDGGSASYTVSLSEAPTSESGPVALTISASNGSVTIDEQAHRFAAGERHKTITVTAVDDDLVNTPDRSATITHNLAGGGYGDVDVASVSVTILDDDEAAVAVSKSADRLTLSEAGGTDSYTVSLSSEPSGIVVVSLTVSGDPEAVRVAPSALTFTPQDWSQPKTVTVVGRDDRIVGGTRRATIAHAISGGGYGSATLGDVQITVSDDDVAGLTLSTSRISLSEEPGMRSAGYELSLSNRPMSDVTVRIASDPAGVVRFSPNQVTFRPNEWNVPQSITVDVVGDGLDNPGDERRTTITHAASGGGFDGVSGSIAVTVADDDEPGLTLVECIGSGGRGRECDETREWEPGDTITWSRSRDAGRSDLTFCVVLGTAPLRTFNLWIESGDRSLLAPHGGTILRINSGNWANCVSRYPREYSRATLPIGTLGIGGLFGSPPEAGTEVTFSLAVPVLGRGGGDGGEYAEGYRKTFTFRVVE